jgi:plasmid stability protein
MAEHLSIRDVDPELWRQLRVVAMLRGVKIGALLNDILRAWLKTHPE